MNALYEAHRDDPEFGYRFLADEVRAAGIAVADRTAWRVCSENRWWSAFGKKRGRGGKQPGPPVHDDLVRRDFTATAPNMLWLIDITEHQTTEGKLYLCAVKDVFSNRIVGYSIGDRMKASLAVTALNNTVARRGDVLGCIVHSDRGSQFRSRKFVHTLHWHNMTGSMGRVGAAGDNPAMESFFSLLQKNVLNQRRWVIRDELRIAICDLDRTHLPPPPTPRHPRTVDPHRIRDHHDHTGQSGRVRTVTYTCSRPDSSATIVKNRCAPSC